MVNSRRRKKQQRRKSTKFKSSSMNTNPSSKNIDVERNRNFVRKTNLVTDFFLHFSDATGGCASDRLSDESSKEAISDSHPETLTDPEFSDPQMLTSSPPQSGDELRSREKVSMGLQKHSFRMGGKIQYKLVFLGEGSAKTHFGGRKKRKGSLGFFCFLS